MYTPFIQSLTDNLDSLGDAKQSLNEINIGLERETLRVDASTGTIAQTSHPKGAGSAFSHKNITTDFSEALLEFVTDPYSSVEEAAEALKKLQEFTLEVMENELYWPNSMPPKIESEDEIKIGEYGDSNAGKMRHLYRVGLSHRYGKMMQAIAGIHYNFSFKDSFIDQWREKIAPTSDLQHFKTERYLHLCRNIARLGFVIPYFFGASPLMSKCFVKGHNRNFLSLNEQDNYLPEGTSFRLSDIGYGNNKCHFDVSYNSVDQFIKNIHYAISTPCKDFSKIAIKDENGAYQQINNHILQIENEYYSSIRPKQLFGAGENFLEALKEKGIEYVELRSLDVNPLVDIGITVEDMRFVQVLLSACFLTDAAPLSQKEYEQTQKNIKIVAERGREAGITINLLAQETSLKEALTFVLDWMEPVAELLGAPFVTAIQNRRPMIDSPDLTPSAQLLKKVIDSELDYQTFFLKEAKKLFQRESTSLTEEERTQMRREAEASLKAQAEHEATPQIPFDQYLKNYFDISL